jgi:dipeptidyl aminopeptidase/acylaminoacyl peptidase
MCVAFLGGGNLGFALLASLGLGDGFEASECYANSRDSSLLHAYFIVPALGGPERKLANANPEPIGHGISWSPDGKYLAVVERVSSHDTRAGIFSVSVESGEKRESGIESPAQYIADPAFSPDGSYLAFVSGSGFLSNDIYVVPVSGGKPRRLTALHAFIKTPAWTSDGRELVFSSNHQGPQTLWRVTLTGGEPQPLSIAADDANKVTISARGNRLSFRIAEHSDTIIGCTVVSREPLQRRRAGAL